MVFDDKKEHFHGCSQPFGAFRTCTVIIFQLQNIFWCSSRFKTPVHYHLSFSVLLKCVLIFNPQSKLRVQGENIYVRHSNLMLEVRMWSKQFLIFFKENKRKSKSIMDGGPVSPLWLLSWAASHSSSLRLCVHALVCVCTPMHRLHVTPGACLRVNWMYVMRGGDCNIRVNVFWEWFS